MYCCGNLYSIIIGETITAVEEDNLFFCCCSSLIKKDNVQVCKYKRDDAGQNRRCVLEIREGRLLFGQMIVFMLFDYFFFFSMKNILDKVSEAEQTGSRRERRHQREQKYLIFLPFWVLVTQLYLGFIPL